MAPKMRLTAGASLPDSGSVQSLHQQFIKQLWIGLAFALLHGLPAQVNMKMS